MVSKKIVVLISLLVLLSSFLRIIYIIEHFMKTHLFRILVVLFSVWMTWITTYTHTRDKWHQLWQERWYMAWQLDMIEEHTKILGTISSAELEVMNKDDIIDTKWVKYASYYYLIEEWVKTLRVHE